MWQNTCVCVFLRVYVSLKHNNYLYEVPVCVVYYTKYNNIVILLFNNYARRCSKYVGHDHTYFTIPNRR